MTVYDNRPHWVRVRIVVHHSGLGLGLWSATVDHSGLGLGLGLWSIAVNSPTPNS